MFKRLKCDKFKQIKYKSETDIVLMQGRLPLTAKYVVYLLLHQLQDDRA